MASTKLIITLCLITLAACQDELVEEVAIKDVISKTSPSYYKGETVQVTCAFDLADATAVSNVGITWVPSDGSPGEFYGCIQTVIPGAASTVTSFRLIDTTEQDCRDFIADLEDKSAEITFKIIPDAVGDYKCLLNDKTSTPTNIPELKVLPTLLKPSIQEGQGFYEGLDTVEFMCDSSGGEPAAYLEYKRNGEVLPAQDMKFAALRAYTTLSCQDLSHKDYEGGKTDTTYAEVNIKVYYLTVPMEMKNMTINPTEKRGLSCDNQNNLPDGVEISITWTVDGEIDDNNTTPDYTAEYENGTDSTVIRCDIKANDPKLQDVSVTYNIIWDDAVSTLAPTTTKPTPTEKADKGATGKATGKDNSTIIIIVVVVVLVLLIAIIIIVVVVIKRKQKNGSATVEKTTETRTPEQAEEGKEDDAREDQSKKLLENQDNNKEEEPK